MLPMAFEGTGDLAETMLVKETLWRMSASGVLGIVWSGGGEPTLHPHWVEILEEAYVAGLRQGMYTLGGHLTEKKARTLARVADWVVVSLDAADEIDYAKEKAVPPARFEDALAGIRMLSETGETVVGVSFLLHEGNWERAPEMLFLARAVGATYATFRPTIETDGDNPSRITGNTTWIDAAEDILNLLSTEKDVELDPSRFLAYRDWTSHGYNECYGIRLTTMITPDGRVWVCPQRRGISGSELGDLRHESFESIWARHPGHYPVDKGCRAMCRLHLPNQVLAAVYEKRPHDPFV
jgi:cyclic pyranopterin phosphate synthase